MLLVQYTPVLLFLAHVSAHTIQETFHVENVMSFVTYTNPLSSHMSSGTKHCALRCSLAPSCATALFDGDLKTCALDAALANTTGAFCDLNRQKCLTYTVKETDIYNDETVECSTNEECVEANTECRLNKCSCIFGYSYNKSANGCTFGCDTWGNFYRPDLGKGVKEYVTNAEYDFDHADNTAACLEQCTAQTKFTCIMAEYRKDVQQCATFPPSFDTSASNREVDDQADLYERDCGP